MTPYEVFLGSRGSSTSPQGLPIASRAIRCADLPTQHPTRLARHIQQSGSNTFLRHSFGQTSYTKHRNINLLSIAYAFQPRLRYRLTLGGVTWPRNPWIFGGRGSRPPYRYLCHHQLLWDLQRSSRYAFISKHNAPLPLLRVRIFGE